MNKMNIKIITIAIIIMITFIAINSIKGSTESDISLLIESSTGYTPKFDYLNLKEEMVISPMFTPDNALDIHVSWINRANSTIDIQNQYITQFDDGVSWESDPSPLVRAIVDAHNRGVSVRVQINEDSDSDNVTNYFLGLGIEVRWMGSSSSNPDGEWLSSTHNKLVIIDEKVTLLSSINFGENAFTNNREAGLVIQNAQVANYFTNIFESDWADGEIPSIPSYSHPNAVTSFTTDDLRPNNKVVSDYPSHTNIPKTNFTGVYNVTLFTNPDNADEVIFSYLKAAKTSIYVSMYTISRPDFNKTLIDLKKANPSMDIQVLISNRRVGASENVDTRKAAESLVANLIPVYNSTTDDDKVDGFYHNKYWIIDGKHVFVYSGNWSPRSVSPRLESGDSSYSSSDVNRDMGIAVHDAPDIASFFKEVWDADVAVATPWELPIGIKQTCFSQADVVSGVTTISAQASGLDNASYYYRWGTNDWQEVTVTDGVFSEDFDTTSLPNGIATFEVKAETETQTFTDKVTVNIVNYAASENWRLLITELLPDPDVVSDTEGEYIELTNSFPFELLIEGWQIGDDSNLYTFPSDYTIEAYTSIIIARDSTGFSSGYGKTADIELSISLTNTGDYVQLLDHHGTYIDVVAYGVDAPDGSESLDAPDAGEAILRSPLHIDTDTASDFTFGSPDPKGTVSQVPLETAGSEGDTNLYDSDYESSFPFSILLVSVFLLPFLRRKFKLEK